MFHVKHRTRQSLGTFSFNRWIALLTYVRKFVPRETFSRTHSHMNDRTHD